jgi:glyoxylase-like metal-dependent hydrolase (beta-lactamase superfamily II)/ferredoxin
MMGAMASIARRLLINADGDFFVDSSCIDCDTCRWMAPETFDEADDRSYVRRQPLEARGILRTELALIACPTGSIGTRTKHDLARARSAFPLAVEDGVHHCGYHAEASFGAASWLVVREGGNVLVDVPRWNRELVHRIEGLGGVATMFLTHQDDVADHARFAAHFRAERVMHADDAPAAVERTIEGVEPASLAPDLVVVPTPGHTKGSACLIASSKFLFSGDHVAWSRSKKHVYAFRDACWYDWRRQIESMERLAAFDFEWILPGHGTPCHLTREAMRGEMRRCVEWMKTR